MNVKRIKELIDKSDKTKHQLAKESGVTHTVIYRLYNGNTNEIKINTAFRLADALGVDVNEFREKEEK